MDPKLFQPSSNQATKGFLTIPDNAEIIHCENPPNKNRSIPHTTLTTDIFPSSPAASDIQQDTFGNCYLLAPLIAIRHLPDGAAIIRNMMKDEGTHVIVRLFDNSGNPHFISIEKSLPENASHQAKPWVRLIEKAYVAFNHGRYHGDYSLLESGQCENAMAILTGVTKERSYQLGAKLNTPQTKCYSEEESAIFSHIREALNHHKPLTVSSDNDDVPSGILPSHTYTVIGCQENAITGKQFIFVKNPITENRSTLSKIFVKGGRSSLDVADPTSPDGSGIKIQTTNNSTFRMELRDFCRSFGHLDVFKQVNIKPQKLQNHFSF